MIGYIYFLQEKGSNNIFYVGSSIDPRLRKSAHRTNAKGQETPLYAYMHSNILDFTLNIIEEIEVPSKGELLKIEGYWINQFKAWGFDLKNSVLYKNKKKLYANINDKAFPIRLGWMKSILQKEAFALDISLHSLLLKIIDAHLKKTMNKKPKRLV